MIRANYHVYYKGNILGLLLDCAYYCLSQGEITDSEYDEILKIYLNEFNDD